MSRQSDGKRLRADAANRDYPDPFPEHKNNGEEDDARNGRKGYRNYIANYTKGLPHNHSNLGEVVDTAYQTLLKALKTEDPNDFENIIIGPPGTSPPPNPLPSGLFRLVNPQAGLAFDLEGPDSHALVIPPFPRIDGMNNGPKLAAEMAELYWMALSRDINFTDFDPNAQICNSDPENIIQNAANDLSSFGNDFDGPKDNTGKVTPATIFRGFTKGDLVGPYISQFLLQGSEIPALGLHAKDGYIRYGSLTINQRQMTVQPKTDFLTNFNQWLDVQNGRDPLALPAPDLLTRSGFLNGVPAEPQPLFIRNLRDLTNYVHMDDLPQEFINAALILLHFGVPRPPSETFNSRPYNPGNPYFNKSRSQEGFATFGPPHILSLVAEVMTRALKAAWFQKWFVHRSLRPEEFGGLIHNKNSE